MFRQAADASRAGRVTPHTGVLTRGKSTWQQALEAMPTMTQTACIQPYEHQKLSPNHTSNKYPSEAPTTAFHNIVAIFLACSLRQNATKHNEISTCWCCEEALVQFVPAPWARKLLIVFRFGKDLKKLSYIYF